MKRFSFIILLVLAPALLLAQNFGYKAKVSPVGNTAFYNIKIDANIAGYANDQLQDLRLFDNDGNEVPYLLKKEAIGAQSTSFASYPFSISKEGNKGIIIIENKEKQ